MKHMGWFTNRMVQGRHIKTLRSLIKQHHKDVNYLNARDKNGDTFLTWAVKQDQLDLVKLLLNLEAVDVNASGKDGSPLIWAARTNRISILKELLNHRMIKINDCDDDGKNALQWASECGHREAEGIITDYLARVNITLQKRVCFKN